MRPRPRAPITFLFLAGFPLLAQTQLQPPPGFTEKVEVNVRTILAVVTDVKGKPLDRPLSVKEVEVLEDGIPAKVLGVDVVRPAKTAGSAAGKDLPRTEVSPAGPPEVLARVPQILYLDASLLQKQSVKKVCEMIAKSLDPLLARGPLEIVLADPEPQTVLPSTSDASPVRAALASLAKTAHGRDRLLDVRADFIPGANSLKSNGPDLDAMTRRLHARTSMQEEVHLVRQSLERLEKWAQLRADTSPAVLYLANDGFDLVLSDFYRNYLEGTEGEQLRMEFVPQIPSLVARTQETLASRELMTVPLAIGGSEAFFANGPSMVGKRSYSELRNPVSDAPALLFVRPLDPLRQIAAAGGGEVVTREDHFALALDRLSQAVAITYRMDRPGNGRVHKLEVRTSRPGVTLRAAQSILDAPKLAAAAQSAVQALESLPASGMLPVEARVDLLEVKSNRRRVGELQVSADLGPIVEALEKVGPGRMRVTLALRASGVQPFVHHEEVDLRREGDGTFWTYVFPLEWPPEATRIAVTLEELKTGTRGAAVAELPSPDETPASAGSGEAARKPGELPLQVALVDVERQGQRVNATIHATIDATAVSSVLAGQKGRIRFQVLTQLPSNPRVTLRDSEGVTAAGVDQWIWEAPVSFSADTLRITVTAVELTTGMRGSVTLEPSSWK
jgi:hypothetical protein